MSQKGVDTSGDNPISPGTLVVHKDADPQHGHIIVRHVGEDSDPVIQHIYFENYSRINIIAAERLIREEMAKLNPAAVEKYQACAQKLNNLKIIENNIKDFYKDIDMKEFEAARKVKCAVYRRVNEALLNPKLTDAQKQELYYERIRAENGFQAQFDKVYEAHLDRSRQLNALIADCVDPKNPKKVAKKITQITPDIRAEQPRPLQENHYEVNQKNGDKPLGVTSRHTPAGYLTQAQEKAAGIETGDPKKKTLHTNPSTIRDERQVGQANLLKTDIEVDGKKVFSGFRHGSPSVLKVSDEPARQHKTSMNVKQSVMLSTSHQFAKLPPAEQQKVLSGQRILNVNMAALSLLSPLYKPDLVDVDSMKQYRQVEDSRLAYWALDNRKIEIELIDEKGVPILDASGDPQKITVKPQITFMTAGVNAARYIHLGSGKDLIERINNRGMARLMDKFVDNEAAEKSQPFIAFEKTHVRLNEIKRELLALNSDKGRELLNEAYADLETSNQYLHDNPKAKDKGAVEKRRKAAVTIIESEEQKRDALYQEMAKIRKKIYTQENSDNIIKILKHDQNTSHEQLKRTTIMLEAMALYHRQQDLGFDHYRTIEMLKSKIKEHEKKLAIESDPQKNAALRNELVQINAALKDLNKDNYLFQTRFAMLSNHMGNIVEWFCKSGEDRTGLLNEYIEAFCIFEEQQKRVPSLNNPQDELLFGQILAKVHNGSPNKDTNYYNDGSRGLKITDTDIGTASLSLTADKKMANMAAKSDYTKLGIFKKVANKFSLGNLIRKKHQKHLKNGRAHMALLHAPSKETKIRHRPKPIKMVETSSTHLISASDVNIKSIQAKLSTQQSMQPNNGVGIKAIQVTKVMDKTNTERTILAVELQKGPHQLPMGTAKIEEMSNGVAFHFPDNFADRLPVTKTELKGSLLVLALLTASPGAIMSINPAHTDDKTPDLIRQVLADNFDALESKVEAGVKIEIQVGGKTKTIDVHAELAKIRVERYKTKAARSQPKAS